MRPNLIFDPALSSEELRGFSRTVAEIEWLLLILVMLYQVVLSPDELTTAALSMAMFFFAAFVLSYHYASFYSRESYWKIAIETAAMIGFITWVLKYSGGADSPLSDLYLLVIIVSALTLGKAATLLEMILIICCYVWLGYPARGNEVFSFTFLTKLLAQISPMVLVAYITTMLSSDIRTAYGRSFGQLKLLAETDELTGVTNVRGFGTAADKIFEQAERYARPFSVMMIDSDSLKLVNDTLGHEAGDRLLKLTVQSIRSELRSNPMRQPDIVARYGGDEFVVLLPETTANSAVIVAERIRKSMESTPISAHGKMVTATVSIGVACYPDHGRDLDTVMGKADQAMYASKSGGKNRTTTFSAPMMKTGDK